MATALADIFDEVEILVAADLLDTDEHGWCPGLQSDTMPNPGRSRYKAKVMARGGNLFSITILSMHAKPAIFSGSPD
jgi:hypothetical protein